MTTKTTRVVTLRFALQRLVIALSIAIGLGASDARASGAEIQSLEKIRQTVHAFLEAQAAEQDQARIEFAVGELDNRLRLAACTDPLEAFLPPGTRDMRLSTVGVRCPTGARWSVFVPVSVDRFEDIVVAKRPLARGQLISNKDVTVVSRNVRDLRGSYARLSTNVVGKILTRSVAAESAIDVNALRAAHVVKRGQTVLLKVASGGIQITMAGTALKDAAVGEVIKVRNTSSNRIVEGRVSAPGTVEVRI